MQRAMAKQAEAERERRAKVIAAEGEFQAAARLTEAAKIMSSEKSTLQLRYLQTLTEISTEKKRYEKYSRLILTHNSTILFPIPIDIISAFQKTKTE